ncbi:hypothetical protein ACJX0J_019100, partial [Zea mays]
MVCHMDDQILYCCYHLSLIICVDHGKQHPHRVDHGKQHASQSNEEQEQYKYISMVIVRTFGIWVGELLWRATNASTIYKQPLFIPNDSHDQFLINLNEFNLEVHVCVFSYACMLSDEVPFTSLAVPTVHIFEQHASIHSPRHSLGQILDVRVCMLVYVHTSLPHAI